MRKDKRKPISYKSQMASGEDPLLKFMGEEKNEPKTKDEDASESND
jgi:hypothetical protein